MSTVIDTTQTYSGSISGGVAPNGADITVEGVIMTVVVPADEVPTLLAQYDPTSGTSPLVSVARPMARVILDALLHYQNTP